MKVAIYTPPAHLRADAWSYTLNNQHAPLQEAYSAGQYQHVADLEIDAPRSRAPEEVFDLTNNPIREEERRAKGITHALSSGDIVVVGLSSWMCCSIGWIELKSPVQGGTMLTPAQQLLYEAFRFQLTCHYSPRQLADTLIVADRLTRETAADWIAKIGASTHTLGFINENGVLYPELRPVD